MVQGAHRRRRTPRGHVVATETGMILITPLPGITTAKPGSATRPFPGVEAAVFDEQGNEVGPGSGGYLVLKRPWPAMLRGIYNDDKRYRETYWSKYGEEYVAGDGGRIVEDGDFWRGREDDVMNVSGLASRDRDRERLVDHPEVAEAVVSGRKDERTGRRSSPTSASKAARKVPSRRWRSSATMSPRKSGRLQSPRTSSSRPSCRRRGAERSCVGSCVTSPRRGARRHDDACRSRGRGGDQGARHRGDA